MYSPKDNGCAFRWGDTKLEPAWIETMYCGNGDISRGTSLQRWKPHIHDLKAKPNQDGHVKTFLLIYWLLRENCGSLDWLRKVATEGGGFLTFVSVVRKLCYIIKHIYIKKSNKSSNSGTYFTTGYILWIFLNSSFSFLPSFLSLPFKKFNLISVFIS